MKTPPKTKSRKGKKTNCWECPLCNTTYCADGEAHCSFCVWHHIFARDEHYQKMNIDLPASSPDKEQREANDKANAEYDRLREASFPTPARNRKQI